MGTQKQILFIVNSVAVKDSPARFRKQIKKYLDPDQYIPEVTFTNDPGHASKLARQAVRNGFGVVAAVGGDGTVNEVAGSILGSDTILAVIPFGSGNGLARHLSIPLGLKGSISVINESRVLEADSGSINDIPFFNIAGVGFDARIADQYAQIRERGLRAYLKVITSEMIHYKPQKFILDINNDIFQVEAMFVSFANSSQFGYNTVIAPGASLEDGLLDIIIVEKLPFKEWVKSAHLLFNKRIDQSDFVRVIKTNNMVLTRMTGSTVNIDGESYKMEKQLNIRAHPGSLRILVPHIV